MKTVSLKQAGSLFLAVSAFSLMLAQPLWAVEETPAPQGKQEESFFQGIKRNLDEWLGRDNSAEKAKEEAPKQTENPPQEPATKKSDGRKAIDTVKKEMKKISGNVSESVKSDGRKAIDTVKKEMKKISDNVSESFERDKKNLKKKLDKLRDKK